MRTGSPAPSCAGCAAGVKLPEIRREDIPAMAAHAAREANPLYPVLKLMDAKELEIF